MSAEHRAFVPLRDQGLNFGLNEEGAPIFNMITVSASVFEELTAAGSRDAQLRAGDKKTENQENTFEQARSIRSASADKKAAGWMYVEVAILSRSCMTQ
ncbi:hypothetical protein CkaCkLH20_12251 [Colletotrichum karsti]|uniref:Uncharacterized protein n=1 Tax=Colletotrichum karsti TaxID=1095194 RepID=A0A9P6LFF7_9PEZI|nr:uncharacterized protein CkaCkLH20_12251 [Colletotrichum karsti]KAF9870287.1 hypothetical protein CkaCkLH20_12251 [Colletotrichum karsti]